METVTCQTFLIRITLLLVAGGLGAVSRYLLSAWLNDCAWCGHPWGILLCNLLGCFLFGLLAVVLTHGAHPEVKLIVLTGFLGAFTTFSTFAFDVVEFINESRFVIASVSIFLHVFLGLCLTLGGMLVGKWLS